MSEVFVERFGCPSSHVDDALGRVICNLQIPHFREHRHLFADGMVVEWRSNNALTSIEDLRSRR